MRKLFSAGAVVGITLAGVLVGVGEASAQPQCTASTSYNNNSYSTSCTSGPGTRYVAYIRCSNAPSVYRFGKETPYGPGTASAVGCALNTGGTIIDKGWGTR